MPSDLTQSLIRYSQGEPAAAEDLLPLVYDELRRLAQHYLKNERGDHTLQATALVHEAYLRLVDLDQVDWQGRAHFMAMAARFMRRILVDHARKRTADKRSPDGQQVPLHPDLDVPANSENPLDLLAIDELLTRLAQMNERHAKVFEMRFFAGLSVVETAHVLEVSEKTVRNDWRAARAWLLSELRDVGPAREPRRGVRTCLPRTRSAKTTHHRHNTPDHGRTIRSRHTTMRRAVWNTWNC